MLKFLLSFCFLSWLVFFILVTNCRVQNSAKLSQRQKGSHSCRYNSKGTQRNIKVVKEIEEKLKRKGKEKETGTIGKGLKSLVTKSIR